MASMVAEGGGGGEQVTPDKAMQMQNAASLQGDAAAWRQAPNEIHMLTGDAAKLRGVRHALVRREWAITQKLGMIHRKRLTETLRREEQQAESRGGFILAKRRETTTSNLKLNI